MQQRSEETHKKIIDVSRNLFSTLGYDHTSVDRICKESGISKGAFYHHFSEKHTVFMEVLQNWLDEFESNFTLIIEQSPNLPQGLTNISTTLKTVIDDSRLKLPLLVEFWRHSLSNPLLWQKATSPLNHYHNFFKQLLIGEFQDGEKGLYDPDVLARVLLAFSLGIIAAGTFEPAGDWDQTAASGFSLLFDNLPRRNK